MRRVILIGLCLTLLVTGCGGGDSSTTSSSSGGDTTSSTQAETTSPQQETTSPKQETKSPQQAEKSASGQAEKPSSDQGEAPGAQQVEEPKKKKTKPQVKAPSGAPPKNLVVRDIEVGTGPEAKAGDVVKVQYVGANYKAGKVFDASWDRGEPFTFTLGSGGVIPGWEQGVEGMKVGGRRELIVPPDLGYGAVGATGAIPPNETLIFIIDLEAAE